MHHDIFGSIDERCDAFEAAWQSGEQPLLSEWSKGSTDGEHHELLIELARVDVEYRVKNDPGFDVHAHLRAFQLTSTDLETHPQSLKLFPNASGNKRATDRHAQAPRVDSF